jgi:hypothetical protein
MYNINEFFYLIAVNNPEPANKVPSSWRWAVCRSKHVEPSINFGIINFITSCILSVFLLSHTTMHRSMNIKFEVVYFWMMKVTVELISQAEQCIHTSTYRRTNCRRLTEASQCPEKAVWEWTGQWAWHITQGTWQLQKTKSSFKNNCHTQTLLQMLLNVSAVMG